MLVSEITGYGELLKSLDDERTSAFINRCTEIVDITSRKYGGTLSARDENSFMVVFGVYGSSENAPAQAISAAIELRDRIKQLKIDEDIEILIDLKSGIDSGRVIASPLVVNEKQEYSITGDTVNLATRLKDLSTEGQILTGPGTYRNTNRLFEFESLKGQIYLLSSGRIQKSKTPGVAEWMIRSEMVGRENELDTLQYYLMKLIQGEGFIVNVIGEAGIGKSRLIAEFMQKEEISRVVVLEGRALSSGHHLSFHPIIDIIRNLAEINETDDESESFFKLERSVQAFSPDSVDEVFPFIATLMGITLTGNYAETVKRVEGEGLEKLILKNLRTLLMGASIQRPLIFMIEDLHWADQSSI